MAVITWTVQVCFSNTGRSVSTYTISLNILLYSIYLHGQEVDH